jgi:hypothetical protein
MSKNTIAIHLPDSAVRGSAGTTRLRCRSISPRLAAASVVAPDSLASTGGSASSADGKRRWRIGRSRHVCGGGYNRFASRRSGDPW